MSDGSVLVGSVSIENRGHIVELWSDDDRYSHGECSCGGWDVSTFDAHLALARWREHVDAVLPIAEQSEVMAIDEWATNGHLIADCARLGYLRSEWRTLDPTYGYGTFWKVWRPDVLVAADGAPHKSPIGYPLDFTALPFADAEFDAVVFDPPYKLNGTPDTEGVDERFGVHESTRWQDRIDLMRRGVRECARVARHHLLVKCQDQVVSGKVRWQSRWMIEEAERQGFGLVDRFDFLGGRPQPAFNPDGTIRQQVHARHNSSQLLVFRRGWWTSDEPKPERFGLQPSAAPVPEGNPHRGGIEDA